MVQRLRKWNQEDGKTKETRDRHDKRGLQRTAYDSTGGHMRGTEQESVESNHKLSADACDGITRAIKKKKKKNWGMDVWSKESGQVQVSLKEEYQMSGFSTTCWQLAEKRLDDVHAVCM